MDFYTDIKLLADAESNINHVRGVAFERLHLALVELESSTIGVSFPNFDNQGELGALIRLYGNERDLTRILSSKRISQMRDYILVSPVAEVPRATKYRTVRRAQSKSNPERLRRRLQKRHNLTKDEARERIPDTSASYLNLPFVAMRSSSSNQHFRLFVQHGPVVETPSAGRFNSYGLSSEASVPWF